MILYYNVHRASIHLALYCRGMDMGNSVPRVGMEPISLAFLASVLTITPPRLPDIIIHPCLNGSLPETSENTVQTTPVVFFKNASRALTEVLLFMGTSQGGRMSRAPASHSGRLGNPKIAGSNLEPAGLKYGRVKPKTLKLILVAS